MRLVLGLNSPIGAFTDNFSFSLPVNVTVGNYYLKVIGSTSDTSGGLYTGAISVSAVTPVTEPEPESDAMLLAGLGFMGAIVMRRNSRKN